ncbi:MAG: 3-hydroxyacyl-CoA dehydrogenase/enoyl-CoA hydratase family protein [Candidatus Thermoplasmatota archaeon]|nr:3-hydroxyacyl-CoA dehydrogenase/enoyl-CoA hydratase family protein [Candidatus Thermoplasmatota archaeon]
MRVGKICVIGAGIMGHGIAEVFAISGFPVSVYDVFPEALLKAREEIDKSLNRLIKSGKVGREHHDSIMSSLTFSTDLRASLNSVDLIVEAVPEDLEIKRNIIRTVESIADSHCIIASNTSNIRITQLQEGSSRPGKIAGMHFFNPPAVMKLVEVVRGDLTDDDTFDTLVEVAKKVGKTPVKVLKDSPGFIVNRISAPEGLFFCLLIDRNMATPESIDAFARAQGLPMGPYELMDFVGIDTVVSSMDYYSKELSEDYAKCRCFRKMLEEKKLGRKSGQGFYVWENGKAKIPEASPATNVQLIDIFAIDVNEAVKILEAGIASPDDIETAVKLGTNRPFGPISVAKGLTNREIREKLESLSKTFGVSVFEPAKSIKDGKLLEIISGKATAIEAKSSPGDGSSTETGKAVRVSRRGHVTTVTISNGRLNLLSGDVISQLESVISEIASDREARVVIFRGEGDNFSAGADLSQFVNSPMDFMQLSRRGQKVFKAITEMPQITVALLKGYVLGGGMEMSLATDIRFSTPDAVMGQPEVRNGLVPGWGASQRLPRIAGFSRAAFLVLTGERISGLKAKEYGIVMETFPSSDIDAKVAEFCDSISKLVSPSSAAVAKSLLYKGAETSIDDGLTMEAISMGLLYGTEDLREGISAMLQKRKPEFKGR